MGKHDEYTIPRGTVIEGKYRIEGVVGRGGMGAVYEAVQTAIGRKVALKQLDTRHAQNEVHLDRFRLEAMAAGSIGHDNICEVTDMGLGQDGSPYLVMPLLRGKTLREIIRSGGAVQEQRCIDIGVQILSALEAAHGAGIIHRDLKPANVFITSLGDRADFVKLLDFGISKALYEKQMNELTQTGEIVGTPHYMAPEQAKGARDFDHRIDIYAVGIMLFEMATGKRPFEGDSYNAIMYQVLTEPIPKPRRLRRDISQGFERILIRATEKESRDRYPNAAFMKRALQELAETGYRPPSTTSPSQPMAGVSDSPKSWYMGETPVVQKTSAMRPSASSVTPISATGELSPIPGSGSVTALTSPSRSSSYSHETWIMYKGKELLILDYSGVEPEEALRRVNASLRSTQMLITKDPHDLLVLTDMTGTYGDRETMGVLKKVGKMMQPHTKKMAMVGGTAMLQVMVQAVRAFSGINIQSFTSRDDAMNWLVKD